MNHVRKVRLLVQWAVAASAVLVMQGCGTTQLSELREDGTVIGRPVFPPGSDAWEKEGSFPNVESLRQVKARMTKDQLYYLLGRPHFREGLSFVREWDYIFHFRNGPNPENFTTCRFKVTFERPSSSSEYFSKEMYWAPESCADFARPAATVAAQAAPPAPVAITAPMERNIFPSEA